MSDFRTMSIDDLTEHATDLLFSGATEGVDYHGERVRRAVVVNAFIARRDNDDTRFLRLVWHQSTGGLPWPFGGE